MIYTRKEYKKIIIYQYNDISKIYISNNIKFV